MDSASAASGFRFRSSNDLPNSSDPSISDSPANGGAKYKLLSPAKLPISRSACITIPPGLSPSSFLESPVLLSNMMKAEPSPTTGSFTKPQMLHTAVGSATYSAASICSNTNSSDERNSSCFEFKPHTRSNMAPLDMNHKRGEQSVNVKGQFQTQSFGSSSIKSEMVISSNGVSLPPPVHMVTSGAAAPAEVGSNEGIQRGYPNTGIQTQQNDSKGTGPSVVSERLAEDGYNWRKYGQKHVKGSEFPRSYYKCTHPNCEVKKLFERAHDGRITEIIYKGAHDHPKPQPNRRYTSGTVMSIQEERTDNNSSLSGRDDKSSIMYGQLSHTTDPNGTPEASPVNASDDNVEDAVSQSNRIHDEVDDDDPLSKRRKMEFGGLDITPVVKPIREPRVVVQTLSEVDILDDGYRWRKYGQKVVRGNPNPRSYYKCTNTGCPVRKHVERASHDPKAVITTYEGKHNHDVPSAKTSSHDTAGPMAVMGPSRIRSEESDTISLDLGVGITSATENRSNEQQQIPPSQHFQRQPGFKVVEATQVSPYYGVLNNQYGSKDNLSEDRSVEIPTLNHSSYPYPQNVGRILTGP